MIYEKVSKLCVAKGISPTKLCNELGLSTFMATQWKRGSTPRPKTIKLIADYFGVPVSYFYDDNYQSIPGFRPITKKQFPILGTVACGEPQFAEEQFGAYVSADSDIDADFCLTAHGDSMVNARIFDGDIIFVKQQDMVDDGQIAVVLIEDSTTVKRVYYDRENNIITLVPENPKYKPMKYIGEQLDHIRILGKVVAGTYKV